MTTSPSTVSEFREQLIQGIGILERLGIIDFNGHFSVRLPDGRILINSGDSVRSALSPDDFVTVGPDGEIDPEQARPPAELPCTCRFTRRALMSSRLFMGIPNGQRC